MTKTTAKPGAVRLLEAIRQFVAVWEQHESLIPRCENAEESAARLAARDALTAVEDCAYWLEAKLNICPRCRREELCAHGWCSDCSDRPCRQCEDRRQLEWEAEREANFQRNVIGPAFGFDKETR